MTVYLITCLPTGMKYVGVTKRSVTKRWQSHVNDALSERLKGPLQRDIKRLGAHQFSITPICSAKSIADMLESERVLIRQHGSMAPTGYNLARGGGVFSYKGTAESIERSAAAHRGKPRSPEASEKSAQKIRGTVRSAETRAKISAARTGVPRSAETKRKLSIARTGKSNNGGEINGQAKLTANQVREARIRLASGESQRSIARSFGIHYNAIWKIASGIKWKSVL